MGTNLAQTNKQFAGELNGEQPCPEPGMFCWNELLATNVSAASRFYTQLFGWHTEDFPGGMNYTLFKQGSRQVGGLMLRPDEHVPPHWLAYVMVENVDASAKNARELGAKVLMPPTDIPTVGRVAVFQDPQGATLGIFQPARKTAE